MSRSYFIGMTQFILASQSPRRQELLQICGYPFTVQVVPVNEASITLPDPILNCIQTAQLKANALVKNIKAGSLPGTIVIAADTIVAVDGQMLGKPENEKEAQKILSLLRSRRHEVHTGMSIIDLVSGHELHDSHTAEVLMRDYSDQEIATYIATGDPMDKAGAYAIQHHQFRPVSQLHGCFLGVMGLSICNLLQMLSKFKIPIIADMSTLQQAHQQFPCPIYDKIARKHSK